MFKVGKSDVLVNVEAFYLMEDAVGAGRYGFVSEHAAGAHHADGQGLRFHGAHLHGGGVRAQQQRIHMAGAHEEGVLHLAGRVVGREVQGLEHVVVVFDFRTFGHIIAELAEDIHDLLADNGNGVAGTQGEGISGHGEVFLGSGGHGGAFRSGFEFFDAGEGGFLEFIQPLAVFPLELRRNGAELFHEGGDFALLTQETHPGVFHFFLGGGPQGVQFLEYLFNGFFHGFIAISLQR